MRHKQKHTIFLTEKIHPYLTRRKSSSNELLREIAGNVEEHLNLMKDKDRQTWTTSFMNELGRLVQRT